MQSRKNKNVAETTYSRITLLGKVSDTSQKEIKTLRKKFEIQIRIVFKPFKVSYYFSLKAKCPDALKSMIVFRYRCLKDGGTAYIGRKKGVC